MIEASVNTYFQNLIIKLKFLTKKPSQDKSHHLSWEMSFESDGENKMKDLKAMWTLLYYFLHH